MKKYIITLTLCFGLFLTNVPNVWSQLSIGGKPLSFSSNINLDEAPVHQLTQFNLAKAEKEDEQDDLNGLPPRFGYPNEVNLNMNNSGSWNTLASGDKIWRLSIESPGARSINLIYDAFWLPDDATLYIYNDARDYVIGGFTSRNNNSAKGNSPGFATGIVRGDKITLEYFEPKDAEHGEISISSIVHGYRHLPHDAFLTRDYEDSGDCHVNVNCSEGWGWENEKNGVALIIVDYGTRWCSGSLIITSMYDKTPYFLTADHCLKGLPVDLDAETNRNASVWQFYWGYEALACSNPGSEPGFHSTTGAILVANRFDTDFALMRLVEDPKDLPNYTPYFPGWTNTNSVNDLGGVGIHHPYGDIKKISTYTETPVSGTFHNHLANGFWVFDWAETSNGHGVIEGGSSGSPLFNHAGLIIGQLTGSELFPQCGIENNYFYGKLAESFSGNPAIRRSLHHFIKPTCVANKVVSSHVIDDARNFYASNKISSQKKIAGFSFVEFRAPNIVMNQGFRVTDGARFIAINQGCSSSFHDDGSIEYVDPNVDKVLTREEINSQLDLEGDYLSCFPNPFREETTINYRVNELGPVQLAIYNSSGQRIDMLVNKNQDAGDYSFNYNSENLISGTYMARLITSEGVKTIRMSIMK